MIIKLNFFDSTIEKLTKIGTSYLNKLSMGLLALAVLLVIVNQFVTLSALELLYRTSISALIFITVFAISLLNQRWGVMLCAFSLPFLPSLTFQILIFTGYGRIFPQHDSGLDLAVAFILATCVNSLRKRDDLRSVFFMPNPACLIWSIISLSVLITITRNLSQSDSPFNWVALFYNLTHFRSIGWHDDYRPLVDWVSYGIAFAFFATLFPLLRSAPDRNDLLFKPLIVGTLLGALVGLLQNRTGIGLTEAQMLFRSDKGGFSALGFQPDIHAFAGQMMMGAVGLIGYLYTKKNRSLTAFVLVGLTPLSLYVIYLSKSKSSLMISILFLIAIGLLWWLRHSKYLIRTLLSLGSAIIFLCLSFFLFDSFWRDQLNGLIIALGFNDFSDLNFRLAYRPEIFSAALRMFSQFPLLGIGQGAFYRLSAIPDFSLSPFLSAHLNGENAHNYFLQTLAEIGILGFSLFTLFVMYPLWRIKNKRVLIAPLMLLSSLFLANIYSHSLLVRENLLIAAMVMALIYAWLYSDKIVSHFVTPHFNLSPVQHSKFQEYRTPLFLAVLMLGAFSFYETYRSFGKPPFLTDPQCFKTKPLGPDGWTSGRLSIKMPSGAYGVQFAIENIQPEVRKRPLPIDIAILDKDKNLVVSTEFVLLEAGSQKIGVRLPADQSDNGGEHHVELSIQRCFIPRNLGINSDGRRLGIQIKSIVWE